MRFISYNIYEGGEGRADPLAEVILAQNADVIALVEAGNSDVVQRIAKRLKMDFIHATGGKGAALFSRWTIRETIDHVALRKLDLKSFLQATVIDPAGKEFDIGVIHLRAKAYQVDEDIRLKQIKIVFDTFAEHRKDNRPHFLMGDFNSNAPYQQIDPEKCTAVTRKAWQDNGAGIPRQVVQTILDAGYLDTLFAYKPELAARTASFTTQYPGQRLDYIFSYGIEPAKIRSGWIEQDRLARYASDHYPAGVEIDSH
ncbi:MAG TPA: endonuclease/exonuclease/phosphatase family protein [Tepidisphaeraceae bacterium]|nr:endonuclease/exonuclease/phosphatase family protein [Tepidisphaeraceae bacterium]